jgi:thiol-disulfide isomerase/thioredoxin
MWWLIPLIAQAAPPVPTGWYLYDTNRFEEATTIAADVLQKSPANLAAHELYVASQIELGFAHLMDAQYADWHATTPAAPLPRIALIGALYQTSGKEQDFWCVQAKQLLMEAPRDSQLRQWQLLTAHDVRLVCGGDAEQDWSDLKSEEVKDATLWARRVTLGITKNVDASLVGSLGKLFDQQPWALRDAETLWLPATDGPELRSARKLAVETAKELSAADDPALVWAAVRIFRLADKPSLLYDAEEHLQSLDPHPEPSYGSETDDLYAELRHATRKSNPTEILTALEELSSQFPETGPVRAKLEQKRAEALKELGRAEKALAAYHEANQANPDDTSIANDFAYEAAIQGKLLEEALVAITGALDRLDKTLTFWRFGSYTPTFADWTIDKAHSRAGMLDTCGWVLHRLERHGEAARMLRSALLLDRNAIYHLHLGLVLHAKGDTNKAFDHLAWGLALDQGFEPELSTQAQEVFTPLYDARPIWHPAGIKGYLASVAREAEEKTSTELESDFHLLLGETFPIDTFSVAGEEANIADYEGIIVVDLWATWCLPCVEALPHIDEIAEKYADQVSVIALSVDDSKELTTRFLRGRAAGNHWVNAWFGPNGMLELQVGGIPAAFVLDEKKRIRYFFTGYDGRHDTRIEEAIEELL